MPWQQDSPLRFETKGRCFDAKKPAPGNSGSGPVITVSLFKQDEGAGVHIPGTGIPVLVVTPIVHGNEPSTFRSPACHHDTVRHREDPSIEHTRDVGNVA